MPARTRDSQPEKRIALPQAKARSIASAVEAWYRRHRRDLPWRRYGGSADKRAYRCLVAEAMLQQTQVVQALGYFERFVAWFPTAAALAAAPEQEVLALWQGLGYYRRARHLQAAARVIVERFGGRVPREIETLLELPGVGRYTAGAVRSIAFNRPAPIVDGNVARVAARLFEIDAPPEDAGTQKAVWRLAETLVEACDAPRDFNQGLMELGATVCVPKGPRCGECPVRGFCRARRAGRVEQIPPPKRRAKIKELFAATVVVERGGRLLLVQRPERGLWSSMWEAPTLESATPIAEDGTIADFVERSTGLRAHGLRLRSQIRRATSHRRIRFDVWRAERFAGRAKRGRWVQPDDLADYPLSNAQRQILQSTGLFA